MTSFNRNKLNAAIRSVNRSVENDSRWRGRFVIQQVLYPDASGCILWAVLRFLDRKTGTERKLTETVNYWLSHLSWEMNNYCRVWEEELRSNDSDN